MTKKNTFIKHLKESLGIISYATEKTGISRKTYYNWIKADAKFKEKAMEVLEITIDNVESKLLRKINDGDTTAIIFYLKTKAKDRGYVERIESQVSISPFLELMKKASIVEEE